MRAVVVVPDGVGDLHAAADPSLVHAAVLHRLSEALGILYIVFKIGVEHVSLRAEGGLHLGERGSRRAVCRHGERHHHRQRRYKGVLTRAPAAFEQLRAETAHCRVALPADLCGVERLIKLDDTRGKPLDEGRVHHRYRAVEVGVGGEQLLLRVGSQTRADILYGRRVGDVNLAVQIHVAAFWRSACRGCGCRGRNRDDCGKQYRKYFLHTDYLL